MTIETRIAPGMRGLELYDYGGIELVGPHEFAASWLIQTDEDVADPELGLPVGTAGSVTFHTLPYLQGRGDAGDGSGNPLGRYIVKAVEVEALMTEITSTALSRLSFPRILRAAIASMGAGEFTVRITDPETGDLVARRFREPAEIGVAGAWAYGRLIGEDPTKYVADAFGISRQAGAQRVARARKAGELPPTTRGAH